MVPGEGLEFGLWIARLYLGLRVIVLNKESHVVGVYAKGPLFSPSQPRGFGVWLFEDSIEGLRGPWKLQSGCSFGVRRGGEPQL